MYHVPIMLEETLQELSIKPNGVYVDLTFGGGGHSKAILSRLEKGQVWAFDQDPDARLQAEAIKDERLHFIQGNFRFFTHFLKAYHIEKVDGVFMDLGVSSHQLDTPLRGFAARLEGPLDMRMHQEGSVTAADVVNTYSYEQLVDIMRKYGDIQRPKALVSNIIEMRKKNPIRTIADFKKVMAPCVPRHNDFKYYAKVFQALRIEVNDEVSALHETLYQIPDILLPTGRFVAITYHSGEDRPIKNFIKTGNVAGEIIQDMYGNLMRPMKPLYAKILRAKDEIAVNSRARSAGMRVAVLDFAN